MIKGMIKNIFSSSFNANDEVDDDELIDTMALSEAGEGNVSMLQVVPVALSCAGKLCWEISFIT